MSAVAFSDDRVAEAAKNFVMVKIDLTKQGEQELAFRAEWGVRGIPAVVFVKPDREEIDRFVGSKPPATVL
ncbi:MAG: hypothetical protein ACYTAF_02775, partial [Planctomycetota bacterium]